MPATTITVVFDNTLAGKEMICSRYEEIFSVKVNHSQSRNNVSLGLLLIEKYSRLMSVIFSLYESLMLGINVIVVILLCTLHNYILHKWNFASVLISDLIRM